MKLKLTVVAIIILFFAVAPRYILGFSLWHLDDALDVAASMGAKLACSKRYIAKLEPALIKEDLLSYSPANTLLDIHYDDKIKRVRTDMLGLSSFQATYHETLGCISDSESITVPSASLTKPELSTQPWPQGSSVNTIKPSKQSKLDALLEEDNTAGLQTRALLWVQEGEIVAESYAPGFNHNSMLLGWSMGKSLTAMMLGRMEYLGQASRDTNNLFPAWQNDKRKDITLESLLTMSSGLEFDETYAPGSDSTKMLFLSPSASDIAMQATPKHPIDSHFSYSSGTTNLINRWMHDRLGNNTQASVDFLYQELLFKLGMHHTLLETDPSGVFVGSSYIYSSARDWARLALLMLNNGKHNNTQLLSDEWVQKASQQNVSNNYTAYGYQFWLNQGREGLEYPNLPKDAFFMLGNRKQVVMMAPESKTILIRLGWTSGNYPMDQRFSQLLAN